MPIVFRAVIFGVELVSEASASSVGLGEWLGREGGVSVKLRVERVDRLGLLVQKLPEIYATVAWEPRIRINSVGEQRYCRYHEDFGEKVEYCPKPASARGGYCREHAHSWKALYELCSQGVDSACEEAARSVSQEDFAVYALDYGGGLKVGLTQLWRLPHRVAEQPHVSAALVAKGPLAEMRSLERVLGKRRAATEGMGVRVVERIRLSSNFLERAGAQEAAARLASLLTELGLEGEYEAITLLPRRLEPRRFASAEPAPIRSLEGRELKLLDYWAGLLAFEDAHSGEMLFARKHDILHAALAAQLG
jgi:hypothetical protein